MVCIGDPRRAKGKQITSVKERCYQQQVHVWYGVSGALGAPPSFFLSFQKVIGDNARQVEPKGSIMAYFQKINETEKPQDNNKTNKEKPMGLKKNTFLAITLKALPVLQLDDS